MFPALQSKSGFLHEAAIDRHCIECALFLTLKYATMTLTSSRRGPTDNIGSATTFRAGQGPDFLVHQREAPLRVFPPGVCPGPSRPKFRRRAKEWPTRLLCRHNADNTAATRLSMVELPRHRRGIQCSRNAERMAERLPSMQSLTASTRFQFLIASSGTANISRHL